MCAQLCPTFYDPMACCRPGSSVYAIFQARILEWVTISCSRGFSRPMGGSHDPEVEPTSLAIPAFPALTGGLFTTVQPGKPLLLLSALQKLTFF